ncbi:MAG: P-loop NTPase [Clostridia bacterium]|nr:P-loop NTPase [Clostridia bacterium]
MDEPLAYVVASGKGGSGKSTLCAGLASALALSGKRVIALDADFGMRNLDIYTGMCENTLFDLSDYLLGRVPLREVVTPHHEIRNLSLVAAPARGIELDTETMGRICRELRSWCDFLLVDAPAGIGEGLRLAAAGVDKALIVATPDLAGVTDAQNAARVLAGYGVENASLLVNRVRPKLISRGIGLDLDAIIDTVGAPILGYVREDDGMLRHRQNLCEMMTQRRLSPGAKDIQNIAKRMSGERVALKLR